MVRSVFRPARRTSTRFMPRASKGADHLSSHPVKEAQSIVSDALNLRQIQKANHHDQINPHHLTRAIYLFQPDGNRWIRFPRRACPGYAPVRGITRPTECGGSLISELWEFTHNPWVVLQTVSTRPDQTIVRRIPTSAETSMNWFRQDD